MSAYMHMHICVYVYVYMHICMYVNIQIPCVFHICIYFILTAYVWQFVSIFVVCMYVFYCTHAECNVRMCTTKTPTNCCKNKEWRRRIGGLMLWVSFRKRATNYRALLQKMTFEDKASYGSWPPCSCGFEFTDCRQLLSNVTNRHAIRGDGI